MKRRRRPSSFVVNIVPLVDVLTVLIFFFLLTMQFKQQERTMNLELPKIETAGKNALEQVVVVAIDPEGKLFLNNHPVTLEELRSGLKIAGDLDSKKPVVIMADEKVPLRYVTEVMDVCRQSKLNNIRLQSR